MMYRVRWKASALAEVTAIWIQQKGIRKDIIATVHTIDQMLQSNPAERGESRDGERRILLLPPLGLLFKINEEKQTVAVIRVWKI